MPRKNRQILQLKQKYTTGCHDKRRFKNEREAREAADYQMLINPQLELAIYKCDFCGGWHLTRNITDQR